MSDVVGDPAFCTKHGCQSCQQPSSILQRIVCLTQRKRAQRRLAPVYVPVAGEETHLMVYVVEEKIELCRSRLGNSYAPELRNAEFGESVAHQLRGSRRQRMQWRPIQSDRGEGLHVPLSLGHRNSRPGGLRFV